jgi:hypothetical protein
MMELIQSIATGGTMLQPKSYPEMVGKALVLEGEPFITMVDDDDPWVEGLFLIVVFGLMIGLAKFVGGFLLTVSLPPSAAILEVLAQAWRQIAELLNLAVGAATAEAFLRQQWSLVALLTGYGGGWARLLVFITVPAFLLVQWLLYGLVGYGVARVIGGTGSLNQTLGATALLVAPQAFLLFEVVPFVAVSTVMIGVWSLLIVYRALQIAHNLPWHKAIWAALLPPALLILLIGGLFTLALTVVSLGGA